MWWSYPLLLAGGHPIHWEDGRRRAGDRRRSRGEDGGRREVGLCVQHFLERDPGVTDEIH